MQGTPVEWSDGVVAELVKEQDGIEEAAVVKKKLTDQGQGEPR